MADSEHMRIMEDESGESAPPQQTDAKTAFCATHKKRHRLSNWPEGCVKGVAEAETITGAGSAEELGDQTRVQVEKKQRPKKSAVEHKLDAAELERRRSRAKRMGRKLAVAPFTCAVIVTANTNWRTELAEAEIEEISEDWADFAEAWGVAATGKIVAAISLGVGYASVAGNVVARVKEKEDASAFKA